MKEHNDKICKEHNESPQVVEGISFWIGMEIGWQEQEEGSRI